MSIVDRRLFSFVALLTVCLLALARATHAQDAAPPVVPSFDEWLAAFKAEALQRGITPGTLSLALDGIEPLETVLERDRAQAEFTLTLSQYLQRRLTAPTIATARSLRNQHRTLLGRIQTRYGVDPGTVVAVWGIESNFGRFTGVRPTIPVLATLAYDPRRATFFRAQLFDALTILDRGDIDLPSLKGSWAGAMGQVQFMPSSYLQYAEDFDGDGRRDIWTSLPDVFASVANYLAKHGWRTGERWGREVVVPAPAAARIAKSVPKRTTGCRAVREMTEARALPAWQALGVRLPGGAALPKGTLDASLVDAGGRYFLVYRNYEVVLAYNCAHTYALSVSLLGDRIGR